MTRVDDLLDTVLAIAREDDFSEIDAISIGGSLGRGEADKYSDIDLFVLVAVSDLHSYATNRLAIFIARLGAYAIRRGPVCVANFGYSCTVVFFDLTVCQLNFNNYLTVSPSPAWSTSHRVLLDRSGYLTELIRKSTDIQCDPLDDYVEAYRYFWIRMLFAARSLRREELWRALRYVAEMRVPMLTILRMQQGCFMPGLTRSPLTRLEHEVGRRSAEDLNFMAPAYGSDSILACLRAASEWFDRSTQMLTYHSRLDITDTVIATSIRTAIDSLGD
ncbi:aminoglycoside 6-adenylyltransferase [Amycolatopsis umgeniensis]|uniref:Nucleotidyltransferase domain-containing protein n=1 Tax=Amycolatopsis umgeniensis TaxID=336628 RepID=A0A841B3K6_9PSEU|nr:hypothetical protein [Amycolatopsis umgeniensis]